MAWRTPEVPSPTPRATGISEVDHVLDLLRAGDATGLHEVVGFERQLCQQAGPQPPDRKTVPCETVPLDGDASAEMTTVPVFTFVSTSCSTSYFTDASNVNAVLDDFVAKHGALSIYGVGRGGWEKFGDGYRVIVTDGVEASASATASIWYLRLDGRIVRVIDGCLGQTAADLVTATGALVQPLLKPDR